MTGLYKAKPAKGAWLVVVVAALFFFYEFIQMNMFDSISMSLMRTFGIDHAELGALSSYYFAANVLFLFVAGVILDRYSPRKVILAALAVCILGTIGFASVHDFGLAKLFRFLTGIGSAFCFLGVIRIASRWFPAHRMGLVTGVVVTMAMFGGFVAQAPFTSLAQWLGWRSALLVDAGFGVVVLGLIASLVRDYPKDYQMPIQPIKQLGYVRGFFLAFLRPTNWVAGLYTALMNLPLGVLGGLWGINYLVSVHHFSFLEASSVTSVLFLGTIVGGPIVGWISDNLGVRRPPMVIGALLSLGLISVVVYYPSMALYPAMLLFFLIGATTATQILSYPLVAEGNPAMITAMSVSIVSICVQAGDLFGQPLFGWLLDASPHQHVTRHVIQGANFDLAMWIFPTGFVVALVLGFLVRETHCRALKKHERKL